MLRLYVTTLSLYLNWFWLECRAAFGTRRPKRTISDNKLLLLSFKLPPQFDSGTHRPLSFLRYGKQNHWQINALTNSPTLEITDAGRQLAKLVPDDIEISEFSNQYESTSYRLTPQVDGGLGSAISLVKRGLEIIRAQSPAMILASAPSFNYLIAGFFLSRITGLPLVLDYRDEWTLCPFKFVSKTPLDKWFEKRCIAQASLITYTTNSHLQAHANHFDIAPERQKLVFNGWNQDTMQVANFKPREAREQILISYVGRLSGHVELGPFLNTLNRAVADKALSEYQVTVQFIGQKTPALEQELADFAASADAGFTLKSIGQINQQQALEAMAGSDFLLLLCNQDLASYIPGKVYDYLSTRVPVIAYGYPGEISEIIDGLGAGRFVAYDQSEAIVEALGQTDWNLAQNQSLTDWLDSRTRSEQAAKLYALLGNIG